MNIVAKILGFIFALVLTWLATMIKSYIAKTADTMEDEKLKDLVSVFVSAAEQQYKAMEHSGANKKDYVTSELAKLGYELTEYLNALIESAVYKLKE